MPAPSSPSRGEGVRQRCRRTAAPIVAALSVLIGGQADADEAPSPAGDASTTVGSASTCPRTRLDCADVRIATRWEIDALARDLPSGRSVWSLLETAEPAAVVDRIDGAGLHLDEPGRFAMRGASSTQNTVLLDGADVTDPLHGGVPLLLPDVDGLESIEATSALAPAEYASPGVTLALTSRAPGASWRGTAQGYGLASGLQAGETPGDTPAIARFGSLVDASAFVSGPLAGERLRLVTSGRLARVRRLERADTTVLESRLASGLLQLTWRAGERDTLRLGGAAQALERPLAARIRFPGSPVPEHFDALGATSQWNHEGDRVTASAFAGVWTGTFVPQTQGRAADGTVERLRDGPVPDLAFPSRSRRSSWNAGGRLALRASTLGSFSHAPRFGLTLARASSTEGRGIDGPIPEAVDGLAARVWDYAWPGPDSHRHVNRHRRLGERAPGVARPAARRGGPAAREDDGCFGWRGAGSVVDVAPAPGLRAAAADRRRPAQPPRRLGRVPAPPAARPSRVRGPARPSGFCPPLDGFERRRPLRSLRARPSRGPRRPGRGRRFARRNRPRPPAAAHARARGRRRGFARKGLACSASPASTAARRTFSSRSTWACRCPTTSSGTCPIRAETSPGRRTISCFPSSTGSLSPSASTGTC